MLHRGVLHSRLLRTRGCELKPGAECMPARRTDLSDGIEYQIFASVRFAEFVARDFVLLDCHSESIAWLVERASRLGLDWCRMVHGRARLLSRIRVVLHHQDSLSALPGGARNQPLARALVDLQSSLITSGRYALGAGTLTLSRGGRYNFGLSSRANFWRELTVAYAIIQAGGKQFRVTQGEVVRVPSISAEIGASVEFDALLEADGEETRVGAAALEGHRIKATVIEHGRGQKIIVFKKKRRKQYKKTHGHRQNFTAVRIDSLGSGN